MIKPSSRAMTCSATPPSSGCGGSSSGMPPAFSTAAKYASGRNAARTSHTPVCARCRYVVSPINGRAPEGTSESFEATDPLPIRHCRLVGLQLHACVVEVVLDDLGAECLLRDGGVREQLGRIAQIGRDPR